MKSFIGRGHELSRLESDYGEGDSHLVIVYGRRRVGKSVLIEKFCEGKRAFIFQGGREKKAVQMRRFLGELAAFVGDPLVAMVAASTWDDALKVLNSRRGEDRIIIVLDEFQWMCERSPELVSDIQRNWDNIWRKDGNTFLILCGSSISFMTMDVLSERSPLFGRRTREIFLEPFPAGEAALFFPGRSLVEKAEALMILGGVPMYLSAMKGGASVRKNINSLAFSKGGLLVNEVNFVLSEQLRETANYFRILRILASGPKGISELAGEMRISAGQAKFYLHRLEVLKFIQRCVPITLDLNSKTVRYKLVDEYLRFYFSYVRPNLARIQNNTGEYLFERITGSSWDSYCGLAFEVFCEKNISAILKKLGIADTAERVGTYWRKRTMAGRGVQIDLVIECSDTTTFLIECKWSRAKTGVGAVEELAAKERLYPNPRGHSLRKAMIASHGVTAEVHRDESVAVVTLEDIFEMAE